MNNETTPLNVLWSKRNLTRLAMLLDPPEQDPVLAGEKAAAFESFGGHAVLVGGSGHIDATVFHNTVEAVTQSLRHIPLVIFPGHIHQIPQQAKGVTGVLNYQLIVGAEGANFDAAFPPEARALFNQTLEQRGLAAIATLYILCGDPNASVSKVSGIAPADTSLPREQDRIIDTLIAQLDKGVDCVFFDSGSRATSSANPNVIVKARDVIRARSPHTLLFIGGGITEPTQASAYRDIADCLSLGTYFEKHGVENTAQFLAALAG